MPKVLIVHTNVTRYQGTTDPTGLWLGESAEGKKKVVPFLNQEVATQNGAQFVQKRFYKPFAVQDGQLITGQNPFSVREVTKRLIPALQK